VQKRGLAFNVLQASSAPIVSSSLDSISESFLATWSKASAMDGKVIDPPSSEDARCEQALGLPPHSSPSPQQGALISVLEWELEKATSGISSSERGSESVDVERPLHLVHCSPQGESAQTVLVRRSQNCRPVLASDLVSFKVRGVTWEPPTKVIVAASITVPRITGTLRQASRHILVYLLMSRGFHTHDNRLCHSTFDRLDPPRQPGTSQAGRSTLSLSARKRDGCFWRWEMIEYR
jgi:hypothetical protein